MSKYTTQIRFLLESGYDLGMKDYPIFDENYRSILNKKILDHYNFYEIGFETAALFKFYLNSTLNEIMPYYNDLYNAQSKLLGYDPITNVYLNEEFNRSSSGEANSNSLSNTNLNNKNLFQDTPQGEISVTPIDKQKYATNITLDENESNSNVTDKSNSNSVENYIKLISGSNGNKYTIELLENFKNSINNIDLMIINDKEISSLFMGLF